MLLLGPVGFTAPWLLLGLVALPLLWLLLRAVPPAPLRRRFPGVVLLLGLRDKKIQSARTPWWLLALRLIALAAAILGFSGPVFNPGKARVGQGNLLIILDASWADAPHWTKRIDRVAGLLEQAARQGRPVAVVALTHIPEGPLRFQAADVWQNRLSGLAPAPWAAGDGLQSWIKTISQEPNFETYWLSDGLGHDYRTTVLQALEQKGPVTVFQSDSPVYGLTSARFDGARIRVPALRAVRGAVADLIVVAQGPDPAGIVRDLARAPVHFSGQDSSAEASFDLPPELRNRVTRFALSGVRSAGAVSLSDDALRRRKVALISTSPNRETLELLAPLHYLRQALSPHADILEGTLTDVLPANPDVIILADVAKLTKTETTALLVWVKKGGLLLRFAGRHMAASDLSRAAEDPLMPVRLRAGGRVIGGTMSWGEPKKLRPFAVDSPFYGLTIPDDVSVTAQVLAQPDPTLAVRVIAALADGTPLVTRKKLGLGRVVLFHITANAEWSNLPLSGLFISMLERLAALTPGARPDHSALAGTRWSAQKKLDGFGILRDVKAQVEVAGEHLLAPRSGPALPPGLYTDGTRTVAVNTLGNNARLSVAIWPAGVSVEGMKMARETLLKGALLAAALGALMIDILASLGLSGRLHGPRARASGTLGLVLVTALLLPADGRAQDIPASDDFAISAAAQVTLAHVITGDGPVDDVAQAGLEGLADVVFARTSIEPALPIGVDLEKDDLSLFPMVYWPISVKQPHPSDLAYAKLNRYLRNGGLILFDSRDGDIAGYGQSSPEARKLRALALPLDIPPLEQIPKDHVLTRTFYLLQDFPGRYDRPIWVEAAPADAVKVEGMPFRNLNDGVSPVIIGGNDWAAAWAVRADGAPMFPVGRGYTGDRQREIAYRFGVNLMMYVLTGNYKSDQVHVPALLQRLGQ